MTICIITSSIENWYVQVVSIDIALLTVIKYSENNLLFRIVHVTWIINYNIIITPVAYTQTIDLLWFW